MVYIVTLQIGDKFEAVFGLFLFLIYVDDISEGLICKISKFTDNTKIMNNVCHIKGQKTITI